jgi:hypothetical protein
MSRPASAPVPATGTDSIQSLADASRSNITACTCSR